MNGAIIEIIVGDSVRLTGQEGETPRDQAENSYVTGWNYRAEEERYRDVLGCNGKE